MIGGTCRLIVIGKSSLITISSNRCDVALVQNEQSEE
jgi:hypothetical protein